MDIFKLIEFVRARPPLWNRQSPLYTARGTKKSLWNEIAVLTGATEDAVRRKWKSLNDIFRREHNKFRLRKNQNKDADSPQWKYYCHMLFLESQIGTRFYTQPSAVRGADDSSTLEGFEELTNVANVSVKRETLDGHSFFGDGDDNAEEVREIEDCDFDYHINEGDDSRLAACGESPVKRAKVVNNAFNSTHSQGSAGSAASTNTTNAAVAATKNVNNKSLCGPAQEALSSSKSPANPHVAGNCACCSQANFAKHQQQHVEDLIARGFLAVEQRRFDECKSMLQQSIYQQQQQHADDDDHHFALSLVPTMRRLPTRRKMLLRLKIQKMICEEMEEPSAATVPAAVDSVVAMMKSEDDVKNEEII